MALADKLNETPRKQTGKPCSVGELLDILPETERAAFNSMMYELAWSGTKIHEALKGEGHIVGQQTINRHRAGHCRCFA